ncbi:hypothetical protein COM24_08760 [Bacillus toyonensis]|uniref:hypothetical protein n=1 Tax=Bacillus cereus group TaxID=86661 RepID=UPI000BF69C52|nr:hypothetical protein [Bacillus toyonensis]PGC56041.1 hypothetical protein COM24_08760 [Bacillus toyonensis]
MNKQFDKKRLTYSRSEDLYFITYNIILILYHLNCVNKKKQFKDYRKLVFLIPIISDDKLTTIFLDYYKGKNTPNKTIRNVINRLYYESIENIILIRYVLMILERKEIITLVNDTNKTNIYLNKIENCAMLVRDNRFSREIERIGKVKNNINRISILNYMTFVDNFFKRNGVAIWEN